jgi:hypothetical protein
MPVLAVAVGVGADGAAQQGRSGQGEEQQALHWVVGACGQGRGGGDWVPGFDGAWRYIPVLGLVFRGFWW